MIRALAVGPVRDVGLLASAVNRPRSNAFGEDAYPTLDLNAAAPPHSMTKHQALVDGNERIAWLSTVLFCDIIGAAPHPTDDETFQLDFDVVSSQMDLVSVAQRLHL